MSDLLSIMAVKSAGNHHLFLIISLVLIGLCTSFNFDGSSKSYGKFEPWIPCNNGSVSFEFKTESSSALLMYTGGSGTIKDYFMLQLINGVMHLSYSLNKEHNMLTVNTGKELINNEWHSVELVRDGRLTTLKVDQMEYRRKLDNYDLNYAIFGNSRDNFVFIGGLPLEYSQKLSDIALPKAVFVPRLRGSVRNIFYNNCGKSKLTAKLLDSEGIILDDNECMKNNPCKNEGICVTRNHGVQCDCTYTDFSGEFCEIERKPLEAMFQGAQYMTYDLTMRGDPIYSNNDQLRMYFKTTQSSGLLFYTGDKQDYLTVSFKNGSIFVAIDLGSGAYDHMVNAGGFKLDDGQWHHLVVTRNARKITIEVDGHVQDQGSTTGDFSMLSSNILYLGGSPRPQELLGSKVRTNFRGCMKQVEYSADSVVLNLIELANQDHNLISVMGDIVYGKCVEVIDAQPVTFRTPEAFIGLPRWDVNRDHGTISFQFSTTESNGLIMYNSGTFGSSNHDFFALEIIDGQFYLVMDIGTGAIKVKVSRSRVDDGVTHSVFFNYRGDKGFIRLDSHVTDYKTIGSGKQLNLEDMLFVGGIDFERYKYRLPKELWSGTLRHGFVGCIQELEINEEKVDLMTVARTQKQKNIRTECTKREPQCMSQPCLHGGLCSEGWNRYICHCENTAYSGKNCENAIATITFNEAQYVLVTLPQESYTEAEDISLRFRTLKANGLLLMTASSTSEDAIELYLERGACKLTVSLGTGSKTLSVGHALNDNQWHTVFVKRRGQNLELRIDNSQPITDNIHRIDTAVGVKQIVLGSMGPLLSELSAASQTSLTIDDIPEGLQSDSPIHQHPWFDGAMQQFIYNGNHFFDMAQDENAENIEVTARFDESDTEVNNAITFESQDSFVPLPHQLLKTNSLHFSVNFKFRTQQQSGLILYSGLQLDFLALELSQGYLNYVYDMGGGTKRILVNTPKSLNDNKWHDVSLFRPQLDQQQIRVDNYPPTVEDMKGYSARHFDLKGPLYIGGLVKTRYYSLSEKIFSKQGFMGCIASFDINGEDIDILEFGEEGENSETSSVRRGCSSSEVACHEQSCYNNGRCEPVWNSFVCNCDMTSFTGPQCSDESVSYRLGMNDGLIVFEYPEDDRRSTKTDYLAFGIKTIQDTAYILRIDSSTSSDNIEVELVNGNIFTVYNMGSENLPVVTLEQKVNDGEYHVIRFVREGSDALLEVDRDYQRKSGVGQNMRMFNDQARIMIGGRKSSKGGIDSAFHGTISGIVFNGLRILDLLKEGDPRVRYEGDVTLVEHSMPRYQPDNERKPQSFDKDVQSTQGVKKKMYKRSAVSENSARRRFMVSNKRSSASRIQYKNRIEDQKAFEEFLTIQENAIAKEKLSAGEVLPPVVENNAQKKFHRNVEQTQNNLGPPYITEQNMKIDDKDHMIGGNVESFYSSGDFETVNNDETDIESSGYSILSMETFPTDDESIQLKADNKKYLQQKDLGELLKSFTMFFPTYNENRTGDGKVKVGRSRNQPFARENSHATRTYPIDRGKQFPHIKSRRQGLRKNYSKKKIHSRTTTPRQVTDDIISSGEGPDCYSDDEDECIVSSSEDDIITPAIVITRVNQDSKETTNGSCTDCKDNNNELSSIINKNSTNVSPPHGTVSQNGITTERSEPIAKSNPGDSGHLNIFLIIGIAAGVLVALIILLVAFYKFRRSDEGSYRVDESQNFAYLEAKKQQSNGTTGASVGNGKAGGKKKDVKEWYV